MKNILKKITALILCLSIFGTTQVSACGGIKKAVNVLTDFTERFVSVFTGSQNAESDVEFTMEQDEIFKARKYFSDSHASTVVKLNNGNLMTAFFAGHGPETTDWFQIGKRVHHGCILSPGIYHV